MPKETKKTRLVFKFIRNYEHVHEQSKKLHNFQTSIYILYISLTKKVAHLFAVCITVNEFNSCSWYMLQKDVQ